jgi:excisionase family DNA binding protein
MSKHARMADLLTTAQVAEVLGVSVPTVNRMANDGRLTPAQKLPGQTGSHLFDPEVVAAYREKTVAA